MAEPEATVCTACPLLCDDVVVHAGGRIERACSHGEQAICRAIASHRAAGATEAMVEGRPASMGAALDVAARLLRGARRTIVSGLAAVPLGPQRLAADLAERLGAAFDTGSRDGRLVAGPTIARAGEVTAAWEELRDRCNAVLLWFVDPSRSHPRFAERFLGPSVSGRPKDVLAIGVDRPSFPVGPVRHLPARPDEAVELARAVESGLAHHGTSVPPHRADPRVATILEAVRGASCVGIVTGEGDTVGIGAWSIARLVRTIAHGKPAFEIPLGCGIDAAGGNAAGAAAIATWRYGATGAIDRACDLGAVFRPGESDGPRVLARGEADAVVVVGGLSAPMRRAIEEARGAGRRVHVVWIGADADDVIDEGGSTVFLHAESPLVESAGEMLREDGRLVTLRPIRAARGAATEGILEELLARIDASRKSDAGEVAS